MQHYYLTFAANIQHLLIYPRVCRLVGKERFMSGYIPMLFVQINIHPVEGVTPPVSSPMIVRVLLVTDAFAAILDCCRNRDEQTR